MHGATRRAARTPAAGVQCAWSRAPRRAIRVAWCTCCSGAMAGRPLHAQVARPPATRAPVARPPVARPPAAPAAAPAPQDSGFRIARACACARHRTRSPSGTRPLRGAARGSPVSAPPARVADGSRPVALAAERRLKPSAGRRGPGGPRRTAATRRRWPSARPPTAAPRPGALVPAGGGPAGADARTRIGGADFLGERRQRPGHQPRRAARIQALSARRNLRCTAAQLTIIGNNCTGAFQPTFDFQFDLRTGGVIADRVHLERRLQLAARVRRLQQHLGLLPGQVRRSAAAAGSRQRQLPAAGVALPHLGHPVGQLRHPGHAARWVPMRFTSIVAQQKGNVSKDNVFTIGERTQQEVERAHRGHPDRDAALLLHHRPAPAQRATRTSTCSTASRCSSWRRRSPTRCGPARVYVYRQLIGASNQNPRGPQFSVRGARNPARQIYEVLRENVDYYIDQSQLWIALVRPLNVNNERLAVAYEVNVGGVPGRNVNTGGTPDIEYTEARSSPICSGSPNCSPPTRATSCARSSRSIAWAARTCSARRSALRLVTGISGDQEKPFDTSRGETYLQLFGLSQATNPTAFDVENRVWPRPSDPNYSASSGGRDKLIRDYFVVFPVVAAVRARGARATAGEPGQRHALPVSERVPVLGAAAAGDLSHDRALPLRGWLGAVQSAGSTACRSARTPSASRSRAASSSATRTTRSTTNWARSPSRAATRSFRARGRSPCATRRIRCSRRRRSPSSGSRRSSRWKTASCRSRRFRSSSARASTARRLASSRSARSSPASPAT